MQYIAVGAGGMMGALLRYGLAWLLPWTGGFPAATFLVNITGSFVLAFLTKYIFLTGRLQPPLAAAVGTGLIGSFTTFSTFSTENVRLVEGGDVHTAFLYTIVSLAGGLLCAYAGWQMGSRLLQGGRRI